MLVLKILGGVVAVALGIWLGRPRRYERPLREVEKALEEGRGRPQWTERHFTPLDLLRKEARGSERRRGERGRFSVTDPSKPDSDKEDGPPQVRLRG